MKKVFFSLALGLAITLGLTFAQETGGGSETGGGGAAAAQQEAQAQLMDAQGNVVGDATFTATEDGMVRVQVNLNGFTAASAGEHGIHVHAIGQCEPDFQAAGGHFNPTDVSHGLLDPEGPHAGDLPNVHIDAEGNATYEVTTNLITLGEGDNSIFDEDGSALLIHAQPDDYVTDPSGNSGDRIVCGVITQGQGQ